MRADREPSLRAKLLEAFSNRWFSSSAPGTACAAAEELCQVLTVLMADRSVQLLPMSHDEVLMRLLRELLYGSEDTKAASGHLLIALRIKTRQV